MAWAFEEKFLKLIFGSSESASSRKKETISKQPKIKQKRQEKEGKLRVREWVNEGLKLIENI